MFQLKRILLLPLTVAQWITRIDGPDEDYGFDVTVDSSDNIVMGGRFYSLNASIYDAVGSPPLTLQQINTAGAGYVTKYSSDGQLLWATVIDGVGFDYVNSVATDADDNVIVGGVYGSGTLSIYDSRQVLVSALPRNGTSRGSFLVKYNSTGGLVWSLRIDGASDDVIRGVAIDGSNNIGVSGFYQNGVQAFYDARGILQYYLQRTTNFGAYLSYYTATGAFVWATQLEGTGDERCWYLTADKQGNFYLASQYSGTVNVNSTDSRSSSYTSQGGLSGIGVKYNNLGAVQWVVRCEGSSDDYAFSMKATSVGNVIMVCAFISVNPSIVDATDRVIAVGKDASLASAVICFDASGTYMWHGRIDGNSNQEFWTAAIDSTDSVYVVGRTQSLSNTLIYGSDLNLRFSTVPVAPPGFDAGLMVKFSSTGTALWFSRFDGEGDQFIRANAIDSKDNVIGVGRSSSNSFHIVDAAGCQPRFWMRNFTSSYVGFVAKLPPSGLLCPVVVSSATSADFNLPLGIGHATQTTSQGIDPETDSQRDSINSLMFVLIAMAAAIFLAMLIGLVVLIKKRRQSKCGTTVRMDMSTTTNMTKFLTTLPSSLFTSGATEVVTTHEVSIPGFLEQKYGADFMQGEYITKGGMGALYECEVLSKELAERVGSNTRLVMKYMADDISLVSKRKKMMFYQEIATCYRFRDERFFCRLYCYSVAPACMVMKFYMYGDLSGYINGGLRVPRKYSYSKRCVVRLLQGICTGLRSMHQNNFVHCDIKPANILLDIENDELIPILTDFGISRILSPKELQVRALDWAFVNGLSLNYAAPETLIRFKQPTTEFSYDVWRAGDIYAVAITMWEMLTRSRPEK